jgi:L-threonylcarbamoyladenylate synthase
LSIITGTNNQIITIATEMICSGKIVAIPTETVYGLAGDISNDYSIKQIFELKNRPINHPLIIHISSIEELYSYAVNVPEYVNQLANRFWPGPLTFILKKSDKVSSLVTGGQNTVAIRMPNHKLTLDLIKSVGHPLAAPSANRFGNVSPTRAEHVIDEFNGMVKVMDGGICEIGIESTIIDATSDDYYKILRPGRINENSINKALNNKFKNMPPINQGSQKINFPGNCLKHYSPVKSLIAFNNYDDISYLNTRYKDIYIIHYSDLLIYSNKPSYKLDSNPNKFAKDLYHALRLADKSTCEVIAIEMPPKKVKWHAILDRLGRSVSKI